MGVMVCQSFEHELGDVVCPDEKEKAKKRVIFRQRAFVKRKLEGGVAAWRPAKRYRTGAKAWLYN